MLNMQDNIEDQDWNTKEDPIFDKFNKITIGRLNIIEAAHAKTDFLKSKSELVYKLAKSFTNSSSMVNFEGNNQKQIRSAGNLIHMNRISRPEWFIEVDNYKERYANIDWIKRSKKINYQELGKKISKSVLQFDLQDNFIKEWDSAKEAEIAMGKAGNDGIGAVCRGRQKTAYGFIWKFKQ